MKMTEGALVHPPHDGRADTREHLRSGASTPDSGEENVPRSRQRSRMSVREGKIRDLRHALEQGSYVVDCAALADSLLRHARRAGERRKRYSA